MQGYFFLDGMDLYLNFGVIIELGEAEALKYPPLKDPPKHDWLDQHGVEVDLTAPRFNERPITLRCALLAPDEAAFLERRDKFITQLMKTGLHRLEFKTHPGRQYFVYYKTTEAWSQNIALTGSTYAGLIGQKFTLTLVEPDPSKSFKHVTAIADDTGRVIIV